MAKQVVNNGDSGLIVRGKINDNFTELYTGKDSVTVANFAALPAPATATGEKWWVLASSGVWLVSRKQAGSYYSDGITWTWLGDNPTTADQVGNIPAGSIAATNVQAALNELDVEKQPLAAALTNTTASFTSAQETKLAGMAAGATVNSTDVALLARANHAGTQSVSTILAAATARIFGRITAASGVGEELTGTQVTTLLDAFTSALKGLVPASGGGTFNFLRADGNWVAPAGGGNSAAAKGVHATQPNIVAGQFLTPQLVALVLSTIAAAANRLDYIPFIPTQDVTIDRLDIEVSTLVAASQARLAIYADSAGAPAGLLRDGASLLDCATAGLKTSAITSLTMTAGTTYWLAILSNSTQTYRAIAVGALMPMLVDATLNTTYVHKRQTQTFASGMPATASGLTNVAAAPPLVKLRTA